MPKRPFSRDQEYLLPPRLNDWITEDDPVRYIAAFIDMALAEAPEWQRTVSPVGAPRYDDRVLAGAWFYGFYRGERSCRAIETLCRRDIGARWLTGDQQPDHNTLWRFWRDHETDLRLLLRTSIQVACGSGMVDLAVMAVDGTKLRANAANERMLTEAQLTALLARLESEMNRITDQQDGDDDDQLPRLRQRQEDMVARVKDLLATFTDEPSPQKRNLTDPDAQFVKTRFGITTGYTAQAAVVATPVRADGTCGRIIVAAEVTDTANDVGQLAPMIRNATAHLGIAPDVVVADAGYGTRRDLMAAAETGTPVIVPDPREKNPYHRTRFRYDPVTDTVRCPEGQTLVRMAYPQFKGEAAGRFGGTGPGVWRAPPLAHAPETSIMGGWSCCGRRIRR